MNMGKTAAANQKMLKLSHHYEHSVSHRRVKQIAAEAVRKKARQQPLRVRRVGEAPHDFAGELRLPALRREQAVVCAGQLVVLNPNILVVFHAHTSFYRAPARKNMA
jgi:hypothetical protein